MTFSVNHLQKELLAEVCGSFTCIILLFYCLPPPSVGSSARPQIASSSLHPLCSSSPPLPIHKLKPPLAVLQPPQMGWR